MSFRKNKEGAIDWQRWLQRCKAKLIECGIPDDAFESQRHWWYFIEHGSLSIRGKPHWFSLDGLSREQLSTLNDFLEAEYGSRDYVPPIGAEVRTLLTRRTS